MMALIQNLPHMIDYTNGFDECVGQLQRRLKELTVLNILKYEYCVNKSRDHFAKNCTLLTNWWPA